MTLEHEMQYRSERQERWNVLTICCIMLINLFKPYTSCEPLEKKTD